MIQPGDSLPIRPAATTTGRTPSWWLAPAWQGGFNALFWLRATLLVSTPVAMLVTAPLWMASRAFPLLSVADWLPTLHPPWDRVLFGAGLLALVLAWRYYRAGVVGFLGAALLLVLLDQTRCQPWFYLGAVLLFLTLLSERPALAGGRLVISAVYFWAGAHKCNPLFHQEVVPFFLETISRWLPAFWTQIAGRILAGTPAIELFIALALWIKPLHRPALILVLAMHGLTLLVLGPLGRDFNPAIWPWNLSMIAFVFILFRHPATLESAWAELRRSWVALASTVLVAVLPLLGYFGWCDAYISFVLYSGNTARVTILIKGRMKERLPAPLQAHVKPFTQARNPGAHDLYQVDLRFWAEKELRVPPLPEVRSYRAIARHLATYAEAADDMLVILAPAHGTNMTLRVADLR